MDIKLISNMVLELILRHDQVGLPGIGTFVVDLMPASFSNRGYTINPPYRRLQFHPDCLEDELLVDLYSRENGVDHQTSRALLLKFLSEVRTLLQDRKVVSFPSLGKLRVTRDGTIFFVSDGNLQIYPEGTGLESVSLKTHTEVETSDIMGGLSAVLSEEPEVEVEPVAGPILEMVPGSEAEPAPESSPIFDNDKAELILRDTEKKSSRWKVPLIILAVAAAAFALFLLMGKVAPDLLDRLLYSPEELQIINYKL